MPPGVQGVQAAHAALAFSVTHPQLTAAWSSGGTLLLLAAPDELALCWLLADAERDGFPASGFYEPDLGGELTAVAIHGAGKLCSRYPLVGEGVKT